MKRKEKVTNINCAEAVTRFNDFMDNYLKGKTREELVKHIADCRHCFERFEFEQMLKIKIHSLKADKKNQPLISRIENLIDSL